MRKSLLAVALMLGVAFGAGSVSAMERTGAGTTSQGAMVMASAADQGHSFVSDQNTFDKKKAKKKKKKKSKKAAAGGTGSWDSGTPQ
ncbi:MAG: hypothetical protein HQM03_06705 [Magnetococcales bacterium]|nr:hypothetical protein [Magnetococcales bacterium]